MRKSYFFTSAKSFPELQYFLQSFRGIFRHQLRLYKALFDNLFLQRRQYCSYELLTNCNKMLGNPVLSAQDPLRNFIWHFLRNKTSKLFIAWADCCRPESVGVGDERNTKELLYWAKLVKNFTSIEKCNSSKRSEIISKLGLAHSIGQPRFESDREDLLDMNSAWTKNSNSE